MTSWPRAFLALIALVIAAPAFAAAPEPVADVRVVRDGNVWTAEYRFSRAAPAWALLHSALAREDRKPWRARSWTVETRGVRLVRQGWYDVLVAERGNLPKRVRLRFTPSTLDLEADYDPALVFTNGAVALFTDQFDITPLASLDAVGRLPQEPDMADLTGGRTRVSFLDTAGKVLHAGVRKEVATVTNGRSYVLFGSATIVDTPDIATVLDPELPAWLAEELRTSIPRLLAQYRQLLGPPSGPKPMLMASWAGPTPGRTSMGGSVLPSLVLMAFEGSGLGERKKETLDFIGWFIAHETAHFWLGQTIAYDSANHAWITEGGADLLAVRALARFDPSYDPSKKLNDSIGKCTAFAVRPVNSANQRSEHDAYYACGLVFGLVAEAVENRNKRGGFGSFWSRLIDANRKDAIVSQADWLAALTKASGDPGLARDIRQIAESGASDPTREIASLFERAGVRYERTASGALRLR